MTSWNSLRRILFPLFLISASSVSAQYMLPVHFTQEPSRNTTIGMFHRSGVTYCSLTDLVDVLHLPVRYDAEVQVLEFQTDFFRMRLSSNNPFVVITDEKQAASIVQLSAQVLYAATAFFVPVESFISLFDQGMQTEISYDRVNPRITVGPAVPSSLFDVTGLAFEQKSNGHLIRIFCTKNLPDYESWLKPMGNDTWLYITLADAKANIAAINRIKTTDFIKKILVFQSPTSVQLTFKLKGQVNSTELMPAEGSNDILVAIHTPTKEQLALRKERSTKRSVEDERKRWMLDVVVIDAGHGGDDPGTIGAMKTKEKDVTLGIALKLGRLIEKHLPSTKVVYTRTTDEFVELYRRGQIANQAGGKLFISIHCNAAPRKRDETKGFEIYLLRPGKTEDAIHIAERENEAVKLEKGYEQRYQKLTEENFILLTMAQSAYMKYSEQFADILQQEMGRYLGILNNGVKQAGFYVLVGASMPNVLLEAGYLSNKQDEHILRSAQGQQRIAEAVFNAVKRYKLEYERSLEEGKELGSSAK
ncbi:MAG: N-acetylmuramoyl-L-alanine amidase [Ignavibacteriae bacterium]|nr:N-acetylmuramoyl-L-alanine amidase [Ignavibacteriota bacterium]